MPLLDEIIKIAKTNLVMDGKLHPVFFLLKDEDFVLEPTLLVMLDRIFARNGYEHTPFQAPLNMEDTKTRDTFAIGCLAKALGANRVIVIWDGAFRSVENPKDFKYDDTEAPLSYPRSMRTECLIFNEVWVPEGKDHTVIVPYKGGEGVPVEFLPDDKFNQEGVNYQSRFTEIILAGYNRAKGFTL